MLEDAFVIAIAFWGQEFVIKALPQILLLLFFLHFSEAWCLQLRPTIFTNDPAWSAQLLSTPVVLQFPIVNEIYWPFVVFSNRDLCPMSSAASVEDVGGLCSGLVPNIIKAPWCREKQGYLLSGGNNFLFSCFKKAFFFFKFWNKFNSVQISPIDFQEISQTCATTLFCPWSLLLGKAGPLIPDLRAGGIPMNSSLFLGSPGRVFPAEGIRPSELVNREDTVGLPHLILPELTGKNCCCDPFLLYLRETSLCRYLFLTAIPVSEYIFRHSVHNH